MNILEITFDEIERANLKNIINMINSFNAESIELSSSNDNVQSILKGEFCEDEAIYFKLKNINVFSINLAELFINLIIYKNEI